MTDVSDGDAGVGDVDTFFAQAIPAVDADGVFDFAVLGGFPDPEFDDVIDGGIAELVEVDEGLWGRLDAFGFEGGALENEFDAITGGTSLSRPTVMFRAVAVVGALKLVISALATVALGMTMKLSSLVWSVTARQVISTTRPSKAPQTIQLPMAKGGEACMTRPLKKLPRVS